MEAGFSQIQSHIHTYHYSCTCLALILFIMIAAVLGNNTLNLDPCAILWYLVRKFNFHQNPLNITKFPHQSHFLQKTKVRNCMYCMHFTIHIRSYH